MTEQVSDRRRFVRKIVGIAAAGGLASLLLGSQVEETRAANTPVSGWFTYWTDGTSSLGSFQSQVDTTNNNLAFGSGSVAIGGDSTVGGGTGNNAHGAQSTVGGGDSNTAGGPWSTVGGGERNSAGVLYSTVGEVHLTGPPVGVRLSGEAEPTEPMLRGILRMGTRQL